MTGGTVEFPLVIRSRVTIAAEPEAVWQRLEDLQSWKASVVSLERLAGDPGREGETLRLGQRPLDEVVHVRMTTLRVQPPAWKVQTLQTEQDASIDGYVVYALDPAPGGTLVSCDVIARCRIVPPAGTTDGTAFARRATEATLAKLDADHAALKRLVEAGTVTVD